MDLAKPTIETKMNLFDKLLHTFDTSENGFSWRKIAGLISIVTAVVLCFRHANSDNVLAMVYSWEIFAAVCIGLVTIPELLKALTTIKSNGTTHS